jgi:hypothetical protein
MSNIVYVIHDRKENAKQKNTGSHGNDRCQGKHPVSLNVLDTLFQGIPYCARPHDILPLSRHLLWNLHA